MYHVPDTEMIAAYKAGEITKSELMKFGLRQVVRDGDFGAVDEACQMIYDAAPDTWRNVLHRLPAMLVNESPELAAWQDVPGFIDWCRENPGWPDRIRTAIHLPEFPMLMEAMRDDIRAFCEARRRPH